MIGSETIIFTVFAYVRLPFTRRFDSKMISSWNVFTPEIEDAPLSRDVIRDELSLKSVETVEIRDELSLKSVETVEIRDELSLKSVETVEIRDELLSKSVSKVPILVTLSVKPITFDV